MTITLSKEIKKMLLCALQRGHFNDTDIEALTKLLPSKSEKQGQLLLDLLMASGKEKGENYGEKRD